ncbi:MAG TPA: hypothetical protein VGB59_10395 [Allosphingosinicella sp.]|jgi:hypothetical protein
MVKAFSIPLLALAASGLSACASEAEPQPDPADLKILLASLETEAAPPGEVQEKLAKADSVVAAIDRTEPDRLAGAAERLLAK